MKETATVTWGGRPLSLETGHLAKQASGAIVARYGETVVLVTVVAAKKPREGIDFFPLSCDYQERTYAAGADLFFAKPVAAKILKEAIGRIS